MRFFRRKRSASIIAQELARVALEIKQEQADDIVEVANDLSIPPDRVETEYRHFMVYMVETVVQNVSSEREVEVYLQTAYQEAITNLAIRKGYGATFWHEQEKRTPVYDAAWQDTRGIGTGVAMAFALARQIGSGNDVYPGALLSPYGMHLLAPLTKYLRKMRIVRP